MTDKNEKERILPQPRLGHITNCCGEMKNVLSFRDKGKIEIIGKTLIFRHRRSDSMWKSMYKYHSNEIVEIFCCRQWILKNPLKFVGKNTQKLHSLYFASEITQTVESVSPYAQFIFHMVVFRGTVFVSYQRTVMPMIQYEFCAMRWTFVTYCTALKVISSCVH